MSEPLNRDLYAKIYGDAYVARLDAEHRRQNGAPPPPPMQAMTGPRPQPPMGPYGTPVRPQPYYQPNPYAQAYGYPRRPPRNEQSVGIHLLLFFLTWGVGNVVYYFWVDSENRRLGYY